MRRPGSTRSPAKPAWSRPARPPSDHQTEYARLASGGHAQGGRARHRRWRRRRGRARTAAALRAARRRVRARRRRVGAVADRSPPGPAALDEVVDARRLARTCRCSPDRRRDRGRRVLRRVADGLVPGRGHLAGRYSGGPAGDRSEHRKGSERARRRSRARRGRRRRRARRGIRARVSPAHCATP